jgi:YfiH family protein
MIKHDKAGLRYYQFETLKARGFFHAVFTRLGGVSPVPWKSLNLGGTVGDDPERVNNNLSLVLKTIKAEKENLVQVRQVHSRNVVVAETPMDAVYQGDAIISKQQGLYLLMRFADCVPIIIYDPEQMAVGIAHAGWRGTAQEVGLQAIRMMKERFGSHPEKLLAGIGPSIGPDHYLIGEEVIQEIKKTFPHDWHSILSPGPEGVKLNLWKANELSLKKAGVKSIEVANICTGCDIREWYSHRAEIGKTGRFGAVVSLTK